MMKILIASILIIFLSTCAQIFRANIVHKAEDKLLGNTKLKLYQCAGVPLRQENVEGFEFLTYVGNQYADRERCKVTFMIRNNIIEKISYAGSNRGWASKVEQCASILKGCI